MTIPVNPKIYHIIHVDRLPSIIADQALWCDAEIVRRAPPGTTIGMNGIAASVKEGKQAEFLMENSFPWQLVERIGVCSTAIYNQVINAIPGNGHRPRVELRTEWYY